MRPLFLALPLLFLAVPATAQLPISGVGTLGNGQTPYGGMLGWLRVTDSPSRETLRNSQYGARDVQVVGQIGRLERRLRDMRDNGELTRSEYRSLRREARHMGAFYLASSRDGLSDFEAGSLQARIDSLASRTSTPRAPTGR